MDVFIERNRHPEYHFLERVYCYLVPPMEGGTVAWIAEGLAEGEIWTDAEINQVNTMLSRFPRPRYQFGNTYWYLWKKPANGIDTDKRPTYAIDKAEASRVNYLEALRARDLTELLTIWETIQKNSFPNW